MINSFLVRPDGAATDPYSSHRQVRPWTPKEVLAGEKESIGSFLSGHPIEEYEQEIRKFAPRKIRELQADNATTVAGLIVDVRTIKTQRGVMAVVRLDDNSGQIESTVYAETFSDNRELLVKDRIVLIEGRVQQDDFSGGLTLRAKEIRSLEAARQSRVREIRLTIESGRYTQVFQQQLKESLTAAECGSCGVSIDYRQPRAQACIQLGERWRVVPSDALLDQLRGVVGGAGVALIYEN